MTKTNQEEILFLSNGKLVERKKYSKLSPEIVKFVAELIDSGYGNNFIVEKVLLEKETFITSRHISTIRRGNFFKDITKDYKFAKLGYPTFREFIKLLKEDKKENDIQLEVDPEVYEFLDKDDVETWVTEDELEDVYTIKDVETKVEEDKASFKDGVWKGEVVESSKMENETHSSQIDTYKDDSVEASVASKEKPEKAKPVKFSILEKIKYTIKKALF